MSGLDDLFDLAKTARENAYAPYSRFHVGAALRTASGALFAGCNVENAAYPVGACAEAGAIGAMIFGGERQIAEILVLGSGPDKIAPCGACRQRIAEFSSATTLVHLADESRSIQSYPLESLLPHAFGPGDLAKG